MAEKQKTLHDVEALRKKLFSRDREIIELVKDANKKNEQIQEQKAQESKLQEKLLLYEKMIQGKEQEIAELLRVKVKMNNDQNSALSKYRVNYGVPLRSDMEEKLHIYQLLTEKDRKIEDLQKAQKIKLEDIKDHPDVLDLNRQVERLSQ